MSRTALLGRVLFVLLLIGAVYSGLDYLKTHQQQGQLTARMSDATKMLALIHAPASDLAQQLAAAQQANAAAKAAWPAKVDSTQVVKMILATADATNVNAIPLTTDKWTTQTINNVNYRVLTIKVSFSATVDNLSAFMNRLYNSQFTTLSIQDVIVDNPTGQAAGTVSGTIDISIFTQSAD